MNRRCIRVGPAVLLVLLFVLLACGSAYVGGPEKSPIDLDVTVEILDNGLKVILLEDHSVPVISYQTFFRVGSRNERPGITGISHFLEHMMFNGAERYGPKEFDRILEANGGYSNAFTSNDMTAYYEDIASDGLKLVIDLDTDRMASLALDPKYLESEMGVVMEERRVSIDNSVRGRMREELAALAYKAHPYAWPVLGWMSDLEKIDRDDCVEYFRTYYAPNNAVLNVAGDFDTREALKLIHKYYDGIPSQEPPAPVRTREPEQLGERRAYVHKKAELPEIMIGYKVPDARSEDLYALEVIQQVLVEGESSRLHRKLVRDLGIAVYSYGYYPWRLDRSLFVFGVKIRPGHTTEEAERAIYEVLDEIAREGVTDKELTKAKNALEANFVRSMQTVNGKATKIGRYEIIFGDYNEVIEVPRRYRSVTSDDVKRVAGKYFTEKQRNVVTLVPEA
ncbi:MAG: insulinase family protein [bacterium]|nr:MAG: insulinase family protein [bacterium]